MSRTAGLVWRTLRPVGWRQTVHLVRNRWQARQTPPFASAERPAGGAFEFSGVIAPPPYSPVLPQNAGSMLSGSFAFQGGRRDVGWPIDWSAPGAPLLWRYNLHYFDWLWSLDVRQDNHWEFLRDALVDWMTHLDGDAAGVGWAPYPTSLRAINWTLGVFGGARERLGQDPQVSELLRASLWRQMTWLAGRLERHLRANHLLENAAALAIVGGAFEGGDARRWRQMGDELLEEEVREQFLADGCHFERSPMYHARGLWLLEAVAAARPDLAELLLPVRERAREALDVLRHPDGEIALLNDAAKSVYRLPEATRDRSLGPWALREAGYYGARAADGEYIIVDAGPIGPDYQPGHAHADLLSFEWSLDGQRVITDTGVHGYEVGPMRAYDRSTAAHNTVEIDGENSIEAWSAFRVGRRVQPNVLTWTPQAAGFELTAEHCGYAQHTHRRTFSWQPGSLKISDSVSGQGRGRAIGRLHFAPGCAVGLMGANEARASLGNTSLRITFDGPGSLAIEPGWYSPEFGVRHSRHVLMYQVELPASRRWVTQIERGN